MSLDDKRPLSKVGDRNLSIKYEWEFHLMSDPPNPLLPPRSEIWIPHDKTPATPRR
jgi:hypothetical protein